MALELSIMLLWPHTAHMEHTSVARNIHCCVAALHRQKNALAYKGLTFACPAHTPTLPCSFTSTDYPLLLLLLLLLLLQILEHEIKVFFCKYNDPIYVKMEKLETIIRLVSDRNIEQVYLPLLSLLFLS
jgi:hypothetical protein